jgi:hypothetical protein
MNLNNLFKQAITSLSIFISCGLLLPLPAKADDLIFVAKDLNDSKYYLNEKWLKPAGHGFVDFVYTVRLAKPDSNGVLFIDAHVKGHCASSRLGIELIQIYNVNDRLVGEQRLETLDFDIVKPGSMQYLVLDAACRILSDNL